MKPILKNKILSTLIGVGIMTTCAIMINHNIVPFISASLFCVVGAITLFKLLS